MHWRAMPVTRVLSAILALLALLGPAGAHAFAHHAPGAPLSGVPEIHGTGCEHGTPDADAPAHDCSICQHRRASSHEAPPCLGVALAPPAPREPVADAAVPRAASIASAPTRARDPPAEL